MYTRSPISKFLIVCVVALSATVIGPQGAVHSQEHGHEDQKHAHESKVDSDESGHSPYTIDFKTHPAPKKIVPDKDMVELIFDVTHGGEPAKDVELSYRVYSPAERFWFSTDFPVVEGTQLLSGSVPVFSGNQTISMILPIRGTYQVTATVRGPEGTTDTAFEFHVPENSQEKVNLSLFLLALFFIGGLGGFIFSKTRPGQTPGGWLMALGMAGALFVSFNPSAVKAHGGGSWDPHALEQQVGVQTLNDNAHLETKVFPRPVPQPVSVGEMLNVRYHAEIHGSNQDINNGIQAESHFVHSEGGLEMANQTSWLDGGQGSINLQLFDGAPHYLVTRFYRTTDFYDPRDDGHEHGKTENQEAPPWEAELEYQLTPGQYTVRFQESNDPAMKWLILPADHNALRRSAREKLRECQSVEAGGDIPAQPNCFNLTLNSDKTRFSLNVEQPGRYRLFTQHHPREFDMTVETAGSDEISPDRTYVTGKGEYLGRTVKWVDVQPVPPPVDTIVKTMLTLLFVTGLGVFAGFKGPDLIG